MTSNNYVTILGWMTNLDIKGNELIVYAIIHGFSQDKNSYFHGSVDYLAQWTNTSDTCVIEILKRLLDKGLLEKVVRDGKTNLYRTINPFEDACVTVNPPLNKGETKQKELKGSGGNNYSSEIEEIITYLNTKLHSRYRSSTSSIRNLIIAKFKSGYTVDDFKTVIDKKYADWINDVEMVKYLRPATLFGNKFDNYLNQIRVSSKVPSVYINSQESARESTPVSVNPNIIY